MPVFELVILDELHYAAGGEMFSEHIQKLSNTEMPLNIQSGWN